MIDLNKSNGGENAEMGSSKGGEVSKPSIDYNTVNADMGTTGGGIVDKSTWTSKDVKGPAETC